MDQIRNNYIILRTQVEFIDDKIRQGRLRWFDHVLLKLPNMLTNMCDIIMIEGSKNRQGRIKIASSPIISKDPKSHRINADLAKSGTKWKEMIHMENTN